MGLPSMLVLDSQSSCDVRDMQWNYSGITKILKNAGMINVTINYMFSCSLVFFNSFWRSSQILVTVWCHWGLAFLSQMCRFHCDCCDATFNSLTPCLLYGRHSCTTNFVYWLPHLITSKSKIENYDLSVFQNFFDSLYSASHLSKKDDFSRLLTTCTFCLTVLKQPIPFPHKSRNYDIFTCKFPLYEHFLLTKLL